MVAVDFESTEKSRDDYELRRVATPERLLGGQIGNPMANTLTSLHYQIVFTEGATHQYPQPEPT